MEACNLESASVEARRVAVLSSGSYPTTVLTYLAFLEKKIGYLRGIITTAPRQIVSAELSCIAAQLLSISKSLAATASDQYADKKFPAPCADTDDSSDHHAKEDDEHEAPAGAGCYEVIQLEEEEILAPHVHTCKVCGKGFKRDANLRMHMRGHGEEYKTAAALAKPTSSPDATTTTATRQRLLYSCPYAGCKRNREHKSFQPLKTAVCVKNHYRRSHCDKRHVCRRCGVKRFSVLADLRTHEKHCGRDRWTCSCGTSFSRKDKLFGHVAAFDGHTPALPPDDDDDHDVANNNNPCSAPASNNNGGGGSNRMFMETEATLARMADSVFFDDFNCSDIKGFPLIDDGRCLDDDGQGLIVSPMEDGIGSSCCDFEGLELDDLFGAPGLEFGTPNLMGF